MMCIFTPNVHANAACFNFLWNFIALCWGPVIGGRFSEWGQKNCSPCRQLLFTGVHCVTCYLRIFQSNCLPSCTLNIQHGNYGCKFDLKLFIWCCYQLMLVWWDNLHWGNKFIYACLKCYFTPFGVVFSHSDWGEWSPYELKTTFMHREQCLHYNCSVFVFSSRAGRGRVSVGGTRLKAKAAQRL